MILDVGIGQELREFAKALKDNLALWEGLVKATGGQLNIGKSSIVVFWLKFDKDGDAHLCTKEEIPLTIKSKYTNATLTQRQPYGSNRFLGVHSTPDGTMTRQIYELQQKSAKFTTRMPQISLNKTEAELAYKAVYLPATTYPMSSTYIGAKDLYNIQKRAFNEFLAAMGFHTRTLRAVVFGPIELGGMGAASLTTEQGVNQITSLLKHLRSETTTGDLHKALLEHYQSSSGLSRPILKDTNPIDYVDGAPLVDSIRQFMNANRITIQLDRVWTIAQQRERDQHIMEIARSTNTKPGVKFIINQCRIYLRVTQLSDIMDHTGHHLIQGVFDLDRTILEKL